jgi:hypothetical protein
MTPFAQRLQAYRQPAPPVAKAVKSPAAVIEPGMFAHLLTAQRQRHVETVPAATKPIRSLAQQIVSAAGRADGEKFDRSRWIEGPVQATRRASARDIERAVRKVTAG